MLSLLPVCCSHVAPHSRIDYRTPSWLAEIYQRNRSRRLLDRWATGYHKRLSSLENVDEWVKMPDLMAFLTDNSGSALIESICNPALLHLSPDFTQDFTKHVLEIPGLLKGLPFQHGLSPLVYENLKASHRRPLSRRFVVRNRAAIEAPLPPPRPSSRRVRTVSGYPTAVGLACATVERSRNAPSSLRV